MARTKRVMKKRSLSKNDLITFLYFLMRDAAPTSEIVRIVRMLHPGDNDENVFTSKELQAYATRLANELLT